MDLGFHVRRMASNSMAVVAVAQWKEGEVLHCKKSAIITHTHKKNINSVA
jgi:hypothetical protein